MLPRPTTAYEIKETSIMRDTNEGKIVVSGKRKKTVMERVVTGCASYLNSLFCCLQVNSTKVREIWKPV